MRVVVTGASGNVGTQVVRHLVGDDAVDVVVGICRRPPRDGRPVLSAVSWHAFDVAGDGAAERLTDVFRGADAVIHLAWQIQPSHDERAMRRTNVDGTRNVADAVVAAGVPSLVYASSVGAYSPAPKDRRTDESWPTGGVSSSTYSRHKATVESMLDEVEASYPGLRIARVRPALVFQPRAGSEIARYFLGPLVPVSLVRRSLTPVVPRIEGLRFQAVHADDVGRAFALATTKDVRGAFNIAGEPALDPVVLGAALGARSVPVPVSLVRRTLELTWRLRVQPTEPGWLDLALSAPVMDTTRARRELGWTPQVSSTDAVLGLMAGMSRGIGGGTPVLEPLPTGRARLAQAVKQMMNGGVG